MPTERQAVEAGTSHAGAEGGGMSEEPILCDVVRLWLCESPVIPEYVLVFCG